MHFASLLSAVLFIPLSVSAAVHRPYNLLVPQTQPYGSGGRYGFKRCIDKGIRSGKISCLNFDSLSTSSKTALGPPPSTPLQFSSQWSVFNITRGHELFLVPPTNLAADVSQPNALIASRYNPDTKSLTDSVPTIFHPEKGKTFDLFGFYMQPMELPPGVKGVDVYVTAKGDNDEFSFSVTLTPLVKDPWYFEPYTVTGEKWDRLTEVKIWAELSGMEGVDWELFVDDLWVRWGNETESNVEGLKELK
ncbi:hypothetical protein BDD12DRAFT_919599 [Trichophaea hybrida]|nr:hypothetical protein BDD12DRAFT_919599 [Trichophaea hybrida]